MKKTTEKVLIAALTLLNILPYTLHAQNSPRIEKLYLSTDKDTYTIGEKIWFSGHLINSYTLEEMEGPSQYIYVELLTSKDSLVSRVKVKRDSLGFHNALPLDNKIPEGSYRLRAYTQWMMNFDPGFIHTRNIRILNPVKKPVLKEKPQKDDFDLQFFPESGILLSEIWQDVAFKAIGNDGLGAAVSMEIFNGKGECIAKASSKHLGMGSVKLNVAAGEKLTAVATCKGITRTFNLPEVESTGIIIQCIPFKDQYICETNIHGELNPADYELALNCRGAEMYRIPLNKKKTITRIDRNFLPDGISSVFIYDKRTGDPVAQRLLFTNNGNTIRPVPHPDKRIFQERMPVTMDICLENKEGQPEEGCFSVAVTDAAAVGKNKTEDDIESYLLLSSDIKGYIEDPQYYFQNKEQEKDLDLLLRTQGWTSYWDKGHFVKSSCPYDFEKDQVISGEILGFFGNKAKSPQLTFVQLESKIFEKIPLGENNGFNIHTDFQDSTVYFLQACYKNGKKGNTLSLEIAPEKFAESPRPLPYALLYKKDEDMKEYEGKALESLYYSEEGAMHLSLEATTITADREEDHSALASLNASHSYTGEDLQRFSGMSVYDAARTFPGVSGVDSLYIRGGQDPALFFVDDMPVDYEEARTLMTSSVKSIEMVNGEEAQFLTADGSGGIFVIRLADGMEMPDIETMPSFAKVQQLGWKRPVHFYQPEYQIDSVKLNIKKPDLRTTIAWEPTVRTDKDGHAHMEFYTSDRPENYRVTVEGVTANGKIICSEAYIGKKSSKLRTDD